MNRSRTLGTLLLLALTGCASAAASGAPASSNESRAREETIRIEVQNLNFTEARLYTVRAGQRARLGIVGGKGTEEFETRWILSEPLRIEINLLAGPSCTTEEIHVDPGDVLELVIPAATTTSWCR